MNSKNIYLFAGTTEGRLISEYLTSIKVDHHVFVATEYGAKELTDSPKAIIHIGRMESKEMAELFKNGKPDYVIDATHSYATIVSTNIRKALEMCNMEGAYLRVKREMVDLSSFNNNQIYTAADTKEAIELVNKISSGNGCNILLTTGVKTLKDYVLGLNANSRIYARILPSVESLNMAYETGLEAGNIIAMEGPFSKELNEALIKQYNISCLVTKNSGDKGGILEKIKACEACLIPIVVIDNPDEAEGLSLNEVLGLLDKENHEHQEKKLTVIGIGMGDRRSITLEAVDRIMEAEVIIGARRMLDVAKKYNNTARFKTAYLPADVYEIYESTQRCKIVFLVSGDSGFYSGSQGVVEEFATHKVSVDVLPGISSVSYLASVAGVPYSDSVIVSCHGKSKEEIDRILESDFKLNFVIKDQAYILCSNLADAKEIYRRVKSSTERMIKPGRVLITVGYNMGQENEEYYIDSDYFDKEGLYIIGVFRRP